MVCSIALLTLATYYKFYKFELYPWFIADLTAFMPTGLLAAIDLAVSKRPLKSSSFVSNTLLTKPIIKAS